MTNTKDSTYTYLMRAQQLIDVEETISDSVKAHHNYLLGNYFSKANHLDSAAFYYHQAAYFIKDSISNNYEVNYFRYAWNTSLSLERYGDCISIIDTFMDLVKHDDYYSLSMAYYFKENTYKRTNKYTAALASNKKRIQMLRMAKDTVDIIPALIAQADLSYHYLKDTKATFQLLDSLLEQEKGMDNDFKRQLYGNYGIYLFYEGDFEQALQYYIKAVNSTKRTMDTSDKKRLLASGYNNIAEVCILLKKYEKAQIYLDSVIALGTQNIARRTLKNNFKYRLQLAIATKENERGVMSYLDTIYRYHDQLFEKKYTKELLALTEANKIEKELLKAKQDAEIENLELRIRLLFLLILVGLILAISYIFHRRRKHKFQKEQLQMQQRLLRAQMNPHFTSNTLYAIQNQLEEDPKAGVSYLLKFSRLLRLILENSLQDYVSLDKEIESLEKYLALQLVRFPEKFIYHINILGIEEDEPIFIPPMLLQPVVENSIEHGFSKIDYQGEISITLHRTDKYIACTVEDNGSGLQKKPEERKGATSTQLIADFLEKATKTRMKVTNKRTVDRDQSGVVVIFSIPYKQTDND